MSRGRSGPGADQLGFDFGDLMSAGTSRGSGGGGGGRPRGGVQLGSRGFASIDIARALGRPQPTPEQVAVIESPVEPLLVVAGAGSGKTETMAARVVWLVANGHVASEEVLGLTFTRKAAGELADRVRSRLRALHRRGPAGSAAEEPAPVTVSTYHAYAAAIVRDHGLRVGVEPEARLLSEAGAWQVAADVVERWDGDMSGVDYRPATVTDAVLALAGECAEHLADTADVASVLDQVVERVAELPAAVGDGFPGKPASAVRAVLTKLGARRRLVPLVEAYLARKRELGVLDFGDQVAVAARIAEQFPDVAAAERSRFRVVLLDEYQDTSHAQLVLLRGLFGGGHPVTAVGDPHQSIYGWRGASAGNLQRFPTDFPTSRGPAATCYLATTWRNDVSILAAANQVSAPLRHSADGAGPVDVPALSPRPGAGQGAVAAQWHATLEDEARAVADEIQVQWQGAGPDGARPTAAVLCRARAQFPLIEAELRARGLPVEVVGLGGLLSVPEVADLRAALEVLHDPTRGDSLMRLLTGPRCRLGPRDLEALGVWAVQLLRERGIGGPGPATGGAPTGGVSTGGASTGRAVVDADTVEEKSIVEAIDELPPADWRGPAGQELSPAARSRLSRLAGLLRDLRTRTALSLPDLVLDVERALLLDIEVAARAGVRPAAARAHLDAFVDVAASFAESADRPGLGAFLAWLAAADVQERGLQTPVVEVRPDTVQVLTIHAAKGLEWDVVAVTGLVEGTFPNGRGAAGNDVSHGWLGAFGALPYPLRGDAAGLPHWDVANAASQPELARRLEEFRARCGAHDVGEERRLAYVAVTRARRRLLLTGAAWGDGTTAREPSRFLLEIAELSGRIPGVTLGHWADPPDDGAANPRDALTPRAAWPVDPLGRRRESVAAGAALVRALLLAAQAGKDIDAEAGAEVGEEGDGDRTGVPAGAWACEAELLLHERDAAARRGLDVVLPQHLSASRLVALAADPVELALRLRRPMPEPPSPHARRGSAFHAWLERRFGAAALVDVDELPGSADAPDASGDDEELALLQARFLASDWALRTPEAVEVALETPVGGLVLRGRVDAVFATERAEGPCWDVVDWKTGSPPLDPGEAAARAVQLAVYRLAWSRLKSVPLKRVGAAFFYARTGQTVRPVDLLDAGGLERLIISATDGVGTGAGPGVAAGADAGVRVVSGPAGRAGSGQLEVHGDREVIADRHPNSPAAVRPGAGR